MANPFSPDFLETLAKADQKPAPQKANPKGTPDAPEKSTSSQPEDMPSTPKDGVQVIKNADGKVVQKIPLKQGTIHGQMESFHPDTGVLTHRMMYVDGLLHGDVTVFNPTDETVAQRIPFVKGKKQGLGTFYQKGAKVSEIPFDSDTMAGEARFYGPNGTLQTIAQYKNNQLHGPFIALNPEQKKIRECTYKDGLLNGISYSFYPSGALLEEATYKDNKVQGQLVRFYEDKTPMYKIFYDEDGHPIREQSFSPKGTLVKDIDIPPPQNK